MGQGGGERDERPRQAQGSMAIVRRADTCRVDVTRAVTWEHFPSDKCGICVTPVITCGRGRFIETVLQWIS